MRAYVGLGSNLHEPLQQIQSALSELQVLAIDSIIDASPIYNTQPVGPQDQPDFYNAVVGFDTELDAYELLEQLFVIENAHERQRNAQHWGPRTLDLDLLLYGDEVIASERLTVPHPRLHERAFVLQPLFDIAPDLQIHDIGLVSELLQQCDLSGIKQQISVTDE